MKTTVYHGSNTPLLAYLRAGTWITENKETALSFGKYLYEIEVNMDDVEWEYLSAEECDWDTQGKGEWRGQLIEDYKLNELTR